MHFGKCRKVAAAVGAIHESPEEVQFKKLQKGICATARVTRDPNSRASCGSPAAKEVRGAAD